MKRFVLVRPDAAYIDAIASFRQEFLDAGSSMDGCGPLRKCSNIADYIAICEAHTRRETLPEGRALSEQLMFVRKEDGRIIGMIQIRLELIGYLERFGGHIGYSVRPSERRKGHAKQMLSQTLPVCREMGLQRLLITCLEDNIASERTIIANGGVYESTVFDEQNGVRLKRFWIEL